MPRLSSFTAAIVVLLSLRAGAATIVVDPSNTDQTIEGFGAFGACSKSWQPVCSDALAAKLVGDLGLSISRGPLPFDFEGADGRLNYSGDVARWVPVWKTLHKQGVEKFIISVWSPPPWMKNPGTHGHSEQWCRDGRAGGHLLSENYDAFARMCVRFLRFFRKEVGVDVYALSIQNEPAFDQPYESCVYDPPEYAAVMKAVGARVTAAGLATKLFGPEDIGSPDRVVQFIRAMEDDQATRQYVGFTAVHGYAPDGVTADSPDAKIWQSMFDASNAAGKPLWMTETSGYGQSWRSALSLAKAIYTMMRFGHVSGWCWWQAAIADKAEPTPETLLAGEDGQIASPEYYVLRSFSHFVRPGAVRIAADSDDPTLLPLAFVRHDDHTLTLVVINQSDQDETAVIHGAKSGWRIFRTTETAHSLDADAAAPGAEIKFPAQSVVTLQSAIDPK